MNRQSPTALGSMLQAATYGVPIPRIYGMTKTPLLAIWAQNLRQGGSSKKSKKKGITTYVEQIDFLLGMNPILYPMQFWQNSTKCPLNFTSQSFSVYGPASVTVSDPYFYAVVGVTFVASYSETFNDYGNPNGSQSVSGTFEIPLWNLAFSGPDPTDPSGNRYFPYVFSWVPGDGTTISLPSNNGGISGGNLTGTLKVYYAQLSSTISHETPMYVLRLTYEPQLGNNNSAYAEYSAQQIIYPPYAGVSSPNYDLGASGALPDTRPEVLGSYTLYSNGDGDFADMAEDIVKSGQQILASGISPTQTGLNLSNLPGCIQKKYWYGGIEFYYNPPAFDFPNTPGDFLVVQFWFRSVFSGSISGISDTAGNSWTPLYNSLMSTGPDTYSAAWYCQANSYAGINNVTVSFSGGYSLYQSMFEIGGCDTLDQVDVFSGTTGPIAGSLTSAGLPGLPSYVMALCSAGPAGIGPTDARWNNLVPLGSNYIQAYEAPVSYFPGTYLFSETTSGQWSLAMLSFKNSQPVNYPKPLGNIMEPTTLANAKLGARAGGLTGALSMNQQKAARDWLKDIYSSGNMAPVYSGFQLKSIAWSEVSAAAGGAIFISPTASGPVDNFTDINANDYIGDNQNPPVTVKRAAQVELPPVMQYSILNRASDYNPVTVTEPDAASISLFGSRKQDLETHTEISDASVARNILAIAVRRRAYLRNVYSWKATAAHCLDEPMDLVTISDSLQGISNLPVRLTKVTENADYSLDMEAEDFIYGVNSPNSLSSTVVTNNVQNLLADPGSVNTPIILEVPPRLSYSGNPELWLIVSGSNANYGGCVPFVSTDGGSSYQPIGSNAQIPGSATTGYTTSDWPANVDPDNTNTLAVSLVESNGMLSSYAAADRDSFAFPCYVEGSPSPTPTVIGGAGITEAPDYWIYNPTMAIGVDLSSVLTLQTGDLVLAAVKVRGNCVALWSCLWQTGWNGEVSVTSSLEVTGFNAYAPWSEVFQVPPISFPYDPNLEVTVIRNAGTSISGILTGLSATAAGSIGSMPNVATFSENLGVSNAWTLYMAAFYPISIGNPPLFITIVSAGTVGSLPSGWSTCYTGSASTMLQFAQQNGTTTVPPGPFYELMTYETANLTGANAYNIVPQTRRAVFSMPQPNQGPDHTSGSRFAFLGAREQQSALGILKVLLDPKWLGQALYFKFAAFNKFTNETQALSSCTAYPYEPLGLALFTTPSMNYTMTPSQVLSQTDPYTVAVIAFTVSSDLGTVYYGARSLTVASIANPLGGPTTFYVTIFDPQFVGDTAGSPLTTQCQPNQSLVGVSGYIYVGSITCTPSGTATLVTGGGWPAPQLFLVNGS